MNQEKPEVSVPKDIQKLLKSYKSLTLIANGQKVQCSLTGHQMLCKTELIEAYVAGKRYQRFSSAASGPTLDPSEYEEILIPSNKPKREGQLFCMVTLRHINKLPHHVAKHIAGRRFQKAYKRWKQCKETGETFKANVGATKQRVDTEARGERKLKARAGVKARQNGENDEDEDEDDEDDNDSLSDLFPVENQLEVADEGKPDGVVGSEHDDSDYDVDATLSKVVNTEQSSASSMDVAGKKLKRKKIEKSKPAALKIPKAKKAKQ